jgi:protein-tyrosine phosphatase
MIKILFVCHGNICRSAAAEAVLKQMAEETGRRDLRIASAAATREEIGNDIYPPMKKALVNAGYTCGHHAARQTVRADYTQWDYIVGMDDENMWDMKHIYGGDPEGKLSMLLGWAGQPGREIDDPWYTRDFTGVLKQIEEGCAGLLRQIPKKV